ncbi:Dihydrofolate reductase [Geodermatophilus dictyosporus]|uniref:Dihydrofolate reductase n=1 Tax=Geodermatophilus dictyosporus TaxID=1523247 RepID=A0A1I5KLZ9_9ACTN|nr:dihydrofolate reductase family protein [Geodermatophilus dictyosporus]SFO86104.1 Dihydrofolate reductase [Geodermatophilus dictyosporus]
MSSVVVSTLVSLDGYVAGPGGDISRLPMDGWFDALNLERLRAAGTLLLGATTYRQMAAYWPAVAADPTVSPAVQLDPSVADLHRETAQRNAELPKVVVSDSLTPADTGPWAGTTTIVRRADARAAVTALRERAGADVLVFGSRTLWGDLLAAGLVDELVLLVGPALLGAGLRAFPDGIPAHLRLRDTSRRPGSDSVLLSYTVATRSS